MMDQWTSVMTAAAKAKADALLQANRGKDRPDKRKYLYIMSRIFQICAMWNIDYIGTQREQEVDFSAVLGPIYEFTQLKCKPASERYAILVPKEDLSACGRATDASTCNALPACVSFVSALESGDRVCMRKTANFDDYCKGLNIQSAYYPGDRSLEPGCYPLGARINTSWSSYYENLDQGFKVDLRPLQAAMEGIVTFCTDFIKKNNITKSDQQMVCSPAAPDAPAVADSIVRTLGPLNALSDQQASGPLHLARNEEAARTYAAVAFYYDEEYAKDAESMITLRSRRSSIFPKTVLTALGSADFVDHTRGFWLDQKEKKAPAKPLSSYFTDVINTAMVRERFVSKEDCTKFCARGVFLPSCPPCV